MNVFVIFNTNTRLPVMTTNHDSPIRFLNEDEDFVCLPLEEVESFNGLFMIGHDLKPALLPVFPGWGYSWNGSSWVKDIQPDDVCDAVAKETREKLLAESDWTDTLSAKTRLGDDLYNAWQTYRQALRDITKQPNYPQEIEWPVAPD